MVPIIEIKIDNGLNRFYAASTRMDEQGNSEYLDDIYGQYFHPNKDTAGTASSDEEELIDLEFVTVYKL